MKNLNYSTPVQITLNRTHVGRLIAILFSLVFWAQNEAFAKTTSTSFPLTERPASESGAWINGKANGLDWADVQTNAGIASGTESGSNGYDDSTAILTGTWGPDQTAQATVYTTNQQTGTIYEEVELRLRSAISAHSNTGYEITFRCIQGGGYVQIVRWNGKLGSYTYIKEGGNNSYKGIKTGDVVSATITGNLIIAYVNGVEVVRGNDSTYTTGNPGIGFYLQGGSSTLNRDFGFSSFTATDGNAAPTVQAPTNAKISLDTQ
jgi:hypothetical protein